MIEKVRLLISDPAGASQHFSDAEIQAFLDLAGHERPEICMKASNKVSVGGGDVGPMTGDFETDNIFYRVRDVFGCNRLDWRATYGQLTNV